LSDNQKIEERWQIVVDGKPLRHSSLRLYVAIGDLSYSASSFIGACMSEKLVVQIVVELVREDGGLLAWSWMGFGEDSDYRICGGSAPSLSRCLDSMRDYFREEGYE